MALYAIGDLHLSLTADKPMEVFGPAWENYTERIGDALSRLTAGDVLVLAGKGHETYQEIDGVQHHLDEREEVAAYFQEPGNR